MSIPLTQYSALLKAYLSPQWFRVLGLAIALLSSIGLQILNPQLLGHFIDIAVAGGTGSALLTTAALFTGVALVTQILEVLAAYLGEKVGWRATNALRADLAAHCLDLDLSFHKVRTPGELVERVDGDVNALSRFFSQFTIDILGNGILLLGILWVLFWEDWRAGLLLSGFVLTALGLLQRIHALSVPFWVQLSRVRAEFFGFVGEHLAGREDVRANGAVSYVMYRFYCLLQRWLPAYYKARLSSTALEMASIGLFLLGNVLSLGIGAYLWQQGAITIGTIFVIFYYTNLLKTPIEKIQTELQDLQQAEAGIYRIRELFQTHSNLKTEGNQPLPLAALSVTFENVWFSYEGEKHNLKNLTPQPPSLVGKGEPNSPLLTGEGLGERSNPQPVLQNIAFHLPAGQTLGISGRTGSGKTTLARLLLRFYDPQRGSVCLGGVPLPATSLRNLRQRVGLVTQDVQLFQATVRDNLTFFDTQISDDRILQTLSRLGLSGWLHRLPQGLDTPLGSDSSGLSAGQAQLLAFARIFLKNPGLVILDEASSRLDPTTEALIEQAIAQLLSRRTGIVIAHRLKTLQRVDHILILDQGRVVEYGDRDHLANTPHSRFAQLLKTGASESLA